MGNIRFYYNRFIHILPLLSACFFISCTSYISISKIQLTVSSPQPQLPEYAQSIKVEVKLQDSVKWLSKTPITKLITQNVVKYHPNITTSSSQLCDLEFIVVLKDFAQTVVKKQANRIVFRNKLAHQLRTEQYHATFCEFRCIMNVLVRDIVTNHVFIDRKFLLKASVSVADKNKFSEIIYQQIDEVLAKWLAPKSNTLKLNFITHSQINNFFIRLKQGKFKEALDLLNRTIDHQNYLLYNNNKISPDNIQLLGILYYNRASLLQSKEAVDRDRKRANVIWEMLNKNHLSE